MNHGDGTFVGRILKVGIKAAELTHKEHSLVDDSP